MLKVIFTLDYEIHGNGEGSPNKLMIEPTARLLRLFDEYGARLTIMADVAEILKFREYKETVGHDNFFYDAIINQLRSALSRGHDVQLHLHSSYFRARYNQGKWLQEWSEYNFAGLPYERMAWMVRTGKEFLEAQLKIINPNYRCFVFRAANWCVSPSKNVVNALLENKVKIDTSVFKGGLRKGIVDFNYSDAYHHFRPWTVCEENICKKDSNGKLWEFPIYSEQRYLPAFLSINRFYRALIEEKHRIPNLKKHETSNIANVFLKKLKGAFQKKSWKADFNQCTGRQLISALLRAEKETSLEENLPFVLIGHSKLFNFWNETMLRPFLAFVSRHNMRFDFDTFHYFTP